MDIDKIWDKIVKYQGHEFRTKSDLRFTYEINNNSLRPDRAKQNISKSDFKKAMSYLPLDGPGKISNIVRGSAYVYAIIVDERINEE